tara:strand:+ start:393 stop:656 length:264 start_codon:yes stop_codon:yes gene_type:complete
MLELSLVMAAGMEELLVIMAVVVLAVIMVLAAINRVMVPVVLAAAVVHIALLTVVMVAGEWDHLVKGHLVKPSVMLVALVALVAKMV